MHLFSSKHDVNVILKKILPHQRLIMNTSFDISRDKSLLWLMAIVCRLMCRGKLLLPAFDFLYSAKLSSTRRTSGFDRDLCASLLCFGFTVHCALRRHAEQSQTDSIPDVWRICWAVYLCDIHQLIDALARHHYYGTLFSCSTSADSSGYDGSQT